MGAESPRQSWYPGRESNPYLRLRRPSHDPLCYRGISLVYCMGCTAWGVSPPCRCWHSDLYLDSLYIPTPCRCQGSSRIGEQADSGESFPCRDGHPACGCFGQCRSDAGMAGHSLRIRRWRSALRVSGLPRRGNVKANPPTGKERGMQGRGLAPTIPIKRRLHIACPSSRRSVGFTGGGGEGVEAVQARDVFLASSGETWYPFQLDRMKGGMVSTTRPGTPSCFAWGKGGKKEIRS